MANFYSEHSSHKLKEMTPKKETIDFLLNYSKALRINKYKKLEFENILN